MSALDLRRQLVGVLLKDAMFEASLAADVSLTCVVRLFNGFWNISYQFAVRSNTPIYVHIKVN
jgi:hypothetical protein